MCNPTEIARRIACHDDDGPCEPCSYASCRLGAAYARRMSDLLTEALDRAFRYGREGTNFEAVRAQLLWYGGATDAELSLAHSQGAVELKRIRRKCKVDHWRKDRRALRGRPAV